MEKSPKNHEEQLEKGIWGPIDINSWTETPVIVGRTANEEDVKEGRAVFYIGDKGQELDHIPINIKLPSLAYQIDNETGEKSLVVLIQAEKAGEKEVAGLRYLEGGNGACLLWELEFIDNPKQLEF